MENALKSNERRKIWVNKTFKTEIKKGEQIIQTFWTISATQQLGSLSLICRNFRSLRKVLMNTAEALKSNESQKIWVHKTFKIEMQKEGLNNSDFLQNWFPLEIRSSLFNLQKF